MNLGSHLSFKVTKSDFLKKKSGSKIISSKKGTKCGFSIFPKNRRVEYFWFFVCEVTAT